MMLTDEQIAELKKPLDKRLVSEREGSGKKKLSYIEGHDAFDQANRIFGYGNWGYDLLYCKMEVLLDPLTGEAIGVAYKAAVRLRVQDCQPVTDVGSQPVAGWNVNDVVMGRRKQGDSSPLKDWEVASARRTIAESHEQAEKGAVTDAVKRALRTMGNQFGNGLYGDGQVVIDSQNGKSADQALHDLVKPGPYEQHHGNGSPAKSTHTVETVKAFFMEVYRDEAKWEPFKVHVLGMPVADEGLSEIELARLNGEIERARREVEARRKAKAS